MMKKLSFILFALILLIIDLITKQYVIANMEIGQSITIIPRVFDILHVFNTGISFSIGVNYPELIVWLVPSIGIAFAIFFTLVVLLSKKGVNKFDFIIYGFLTAGALGNSIDRIINKHVTDFFHLYYQEYSFPIFNVADILLSLGVIMMILSMFKNENNPS